MTGWLAAVTSGSDEQGAPARGQVVPPGAVGGVEHLAACPAAQLAPPEVMVDRLRITVTEKQGCGGFGGVVGEAVQIGELDCPDVAHEQAERTAGLDGTELVWVADQPDLRPASRAWARRPCNRSVPAIPASPTSSTSAGPRSKNGSPRPEAVPAGWASRAAARPAACVRVDIRPVDPGRSLGLVLSGSGRPRRCNRRRSGRLPGPGGGRGPHWPRGELRGRSG
jgi:hypothetical protein